MFSIHFLTLMVAPSSEAGDSYPCKLASELNCHHNAQCLAHFSFILIFLLNLINLYINGGTILLVERCMFNLSLMLW